MASERRKSRRFDINQMIKLSLGKETFVGALGVNISDLGLLCRTDSEVELHGRVFVVVTLKGKGGDIEISCEGIVMHCTTTTKPKSAYEVGVQFTSMKDEDRQNLHEFFDRL